MLAIAPRTGAASLRASGPIGPGQFFRWRGWTRERWAGYVGEPALARADFGKIMLARIARQGAERLARMVKGETPALEESFR